MPFSAGQLWTSLIEVQIKCQVIYYSLWIYSLCILFASSIGTGMGLLISLSRFLSDPALDVGCPSRDEDVSPQFQIIGASYTVGEDH